MIVDDNIWLEPELSAIMTCSRVHILTSPSEDTEEWSFSKPFSMFGGGTVTIVPAKGLKCPRCWMYTSMAEEEPCERCAGVVERLAAPTT